MLLLDTSVASLLHPKKSASPFGPLYRADVTGHPLAISFQTLAELFLWAEQNNWGAEPRLQLEQVIAQFRVLREDLQVIRVWADVMGRTRAAGRRLEGDDAWVLATAVRFDLPLVTHDADFLDLPIPNLRIITRLR